MPYAQRVNGQPACRRYDLFTGSPTSPEQVANSQHYQTGSNIPTRKYGWSAYLCSGLYTAMCEVPADVLPCPPPAAEMPSPPSPPQPPSPPSPPNCKSAGPSSTQLPCSMVEQHPMGPSSRNSQLFANVECKWRHMIK